MKLRLVMVAAASLLLNACAVLLPGEGRRIETDWQKVQLVEEYHQKRGSVVVWMNYPTRAVSAERPAQSEPK
jgi:hypothetical protein